VNKQGEVREGVAIKLFTFDGGEVLRWLYNDEKERKEYRHRANKLLSYLHSQGVVIKIDRKERMMGYTLADGETLKEALVPCPLCERVGGFVKALARIASNDGRGDIHPSPADHLRALATKALLNAGYRYKGAGQWQESQI